MRLGIIPADVDWLLLRGEGKFGALGLMVRLESSPSLHTEYSIRIRHELNCVSTLLRLLRKDEWGIAASEYYSCAFWMCSYLNLHIL